jgi:hypothetical protein
MERKELEEMLGRKDWKRGWNNKWRRDRDGRVGREVGFDGRPGRVDERMDAMELQREDDRK